MGYREEQIEIVGLETVGELVKEDILDADKGDKAAGLIERILKKEEAKLEALDQEAKELMKRHAEQMWRQGVDQNVMFRKIRAKLADEKGIVL